MLSVYRPPPWKIKLKSIVTSVTYEYPLTQLMYSLTLMIFSGLLKLWTQMSFPSKTQNQISSYWKFSNMTRSTQVLVLVFTISIPPVFPVLQRCQPVSTKWGNISIWTGSGSIPIAVRLIPRHTNDRFEDTTMAGDESCVDESGCCCSSSPWICRSSCLCLIV